MNKYVEYIQKLLDANKSMQTMGMSDPVTKGQQLLLESILEEFETL